MSGCGVAPDPPLGGSIVDPALSGALRPDPASTGAVVVETEIDVELGAGQGMAGRAGRDGIDGGNTTYAFTFAAATSWSIAHGLGRFPAVTTLDTAGEAFGADVTYPDANTVRIAFSVPVAGTAYLN